MYSWSYLTLTTAILNFLLGFLVLVKCEDKKFSIRFFVFSVAVSLWATVNYIFEVYYQSMLLWKSVYSTGSLVLTFAFPWIYSFIDKKPKKFVSFTIAIIGALLFIAPFIDELVIKDINIGSQIISLNYYKAGPLFYLFFAILFSLLGFMFYEIITAFRRSKGLKRVQIRYVLIGLTIFATVVVIYNLILPLLNIMIMSAIDAESSIIWMAFATYAIFTQRLFNIKLVIIEIIIYVYILGLAISIPFSSVWTEMIIKFVYLIAAAFGSTIILKYFHKEEQRRIEVEELDKRKSNFLADIAHKLKTPLTITRMNIDLAKKEIEANNLEEAKESAIHSMQSVDKLARLCTNLITLGKIDFGISKLNKTEIDFSQLVKSSANDFKVILGNRQLTTNIEPNISIIGDSDRLQEMILNLLDNAVKFTDPDKGKVSVSLSVIPEKSGIQDLDSRLRSPRSRSGVAGGNDKGGDGNDTNKKSEVRSPSTPLRIKKKSAQDKDKDTIMLTISDNGIGIDEEVLPNLFSRYYQVESRSGSAGIGLSIVKWIVEGHGGTIEIKSKKGVGTVLRIIFYI